MWLSKCGSVDFQVPDTQPFQTASTLHRLESEQAENLRFWAYSSLGVLSLDIENPQWLWLRGFRKVEILCYVVAFFFPPKTAYLCSSFSLPPLAPWVALFSSSSHSGHCWSLSLPWNNLCMVSITPLLVSLSLAGSPFPVSFTSFPSSKFWAQVISLPTSFPESSHLALWP